MVFNWILGVISALLIYGQNGNDSQSSGKWKIQRPMNTPSGFACYLDELVLENDSFEVTFVTEKNGQQKTHTFKGTQQQHEDYLELERVGSLHHLKWDAGAINFEFDYDTSLGYFCSYLEWEGHTHKAFLGVGKRIISKSQVAETP